MKTKLIFLSVLTALISFSCEDSTISEIGTSIMPDGDKIQMYENTVPITLKTIKVDSIYAKTINGSLGEYFDPTFGTLNAGFVCQFFPAIGFDSTRFITDMIDGKIDSVFLEMYYSYMGDSLAPMGLTVYPINKPLEKNYYTSVDPEEFADMANPITRFAYTARNPNIPLSSIGVLEIPMPAEWAQKYVDSLKNNKDMSADNFVKMFPGLYLKSTFGSGCMLFMNNSTNAFTDNAYTQIAIQYRTKEPGESYLGGDSTITRYLVWGVTTEAIQINSYTHTNMDYLFQSDSVSYLKSPAGVFTEVTIPIPEIIQKVGRRQFSSVKLSLKAFPRNDWNYSLSFPGLGYSSTSSVAAKLLLISPDSVKTFFEQQKVADNMTSYTTMFATSTYTYDFSNISNLIQFAIAHNPNEDLKLWVIPVRTSYTPSSTSSGYIDFATSYDLYPTGVAFKGNDQEIQIIASDLQINQ